MRLSWVSAPNPSNNRSAPNATKLSRISFAVQGLELLASGFGHEGVLLGSSLADAWFVSAWKRWRLLNGSNLLVDVIAGVSFTNGIKQAA